MAKVSKTPPLDYQVTELNPNISEKNSQGGKTCPKLASI